jgi:hypothetical protein
MAIFPKLNRAILAYEQDVYIPPPYAIHIRVGDP